MGTSETSIKLTHPGLEISGLISHLERSPSPILLHNNQHKLDLKNGNLNDIITQLENILIKFVPANFAELLWLYKTESIVFITTRIVDDYNLNLNVLRRTFQMNGKNWDRNPIHLHLLSKEIFDCLKFDKNRIYFARKISNISRMSLYLSICIGWAVFFKALKKNVIMYRFHKFSEIIEHIQKIDLETIRNKENELYILLESISFLLNTITGPKIPEEINKRYKLYFEYEKADLSELKTWCIRLNRMFCIQATDYEKSNINNTLIISDLIELDILHFLENICSNNDETNKFV